MLDDLTERALLKVAKCHFFDVFDVDPRMATVYFQDRDQPRSNIRRWLPEAKMVAVCLAVFVVLRFGIGFSQTAAVEVTAAVQVLADTTDGMLDETDSTTVLDPSGAVGATKHAGVGVLGGVGHASTGLGWMRLNAFSDSTVPMGFAQGYLDTIAVGEFVDEVTVIPTNPALMNQAGTATFAYHVDGFVSRGAGASGVQAAINSPNPGLGTTFANDFYGEAFGTNIDATREFTQPVIFGQPFELRVFMFARARVEADDMATFAEVDLGNTFQWMGALEVVDQSEAEVTDYSISSASGTDYRHAILAPDDMEPLPGDYNSDGTVNLADYTVWRDNLGAADETALGGNGTNTGGVDSLDYPWWKERFEAAAQAATRTGAVPTAVPEPPGWLLVCWVGVGLVCRGAGRRPCGQRRSYLQKKEPGHDCPGSLLTMET